MSAKRRKAEVPERVPGRLFRARSRHWTIAGNLALLAEHIVPALSEQSVEPASDHELPVSDYGYKLDIIIS